MEKQKGLIAPNVEEIVDTADFYGIGSGDFIVKDFYVTQAIHHLSTFKLDYAELIFCGGTCLSKGHQITHRMSEDVDFKLFLENANSGQSSLRKLCGHIKKELAKSLLDFGFEIPEGDIIGRVNNQYVCMKLFFQDTKSATKNLRDYIKLEIRYTPLQHAYINLSVSSLIDLAHNRNAAKSIKSSTLEVTTAEKWVALTRRLLVEYEPALLRHLYDIHMILLSNKLNKALVLELIQQSIEYDAVQFKGKHIEYHNNPKAIIQESLIQLQTQSKYRQDYEQFLQGMVFGGNLPQYDTALESVLSFKNI